MNSYAIEPKDSSPSVDFDASLSAVKADSRYSLTAISGLPLPMTDIASWTKTKTLRLLEKD